MKRSPDWLLVVAAVAALAAMFWLGSTTRVEAHSLSGCVGVRVYLFDHDDQTGTLANQCINGADGWQWNFDLPPWSIPNRVESTAYRTPVEGDCWQIKLWDAATATNFSTVVLGTNRDYHLEVPASWDNKADWLSINGC